MSKKQVLIATVMLAVTVQPSFATSPSDAQQGDLPGASAIQDGGFTLAPLAFVRFCMNNPAECSAQSSENSVVLDRDKWRAMNDVNHVINTRIEADPTTGGRSAWSLTTARGDCNDYAVQKRHELIARGWPAAALALAVVTTDAGKGHLVLSVRTDRGDLVLDNLQEKVVPWESANYHWIKRQSASNPQYWVEVTAATEAAYKHASVTPDTAPAASDAVTVASAKAE